MGAQKRRVLRALRNHPAGVCQPEFLLPNVLDGGPPITRLAARIKDLREDGHDIDVVGEKWGCAVYQLRRENTPPGPSDIHRDARGAEVHESDPWDESTLFDLPRRPLGPYDQDAA